MGKTHRYDVALDDKRFQKVSDFQNNFGLKNTTTGARLLIVVGLMFWRRLFKDFNYSQYNGLKKHTGNKADSEQQKFLLQWLEDKDTSMPTGGKAEIERILSGEINDTLDKLNEDAYEQAEKDVNFSWWLTFIGGIMIGFSIGAGVVALYYNGVIL